MIPYSDLHSQIMGYALIPIAARQELIARIWEQGQRKTRAYAALCACAAFAHQQREAWLEHAHFSNRCRSDALASLGNNRVHVLSRLFPLLRSRLGRKEGAAIG